ncbi:MAG TPA: hypothetical protein VJ964_00415 [Balneolaceae bacterium]|nr:hypothetical protein [Balneolaceae bacterium]
MKRLTFILGGVLFLLQACAPEPVYRLKSRAAEKNITYHKGVQYITLQNDSVQVVMSYYKHYSGIFSMDVEVDNNTNQIIRVNPKDFKYEAFEGVNADSSVQPIATRWAKDPEEKMLNIDLAISQQEANKKTDDLFFVAMQGIAVTQGVTADNDEERRKASRQIHRNNVDHAVDRQQYHANQVGLKNRREIWQQDALRTTDLWPGDSIRGLIFFETDSHASAYDFLIDIEGRKFSSWFWQFKYYPNQPTED